MILLILTTNAAELKKNLLYNIALARAVGIYQFKRQYYVTKFYFEPLTHQQQNIGQNRRKIISNFFIFKLINTG